MKVLVPLAEGVEEKAAAIATAMVVA